MQIDIGISETMIGFRMLRQTELNLYPIGKHGLKNTHELSTAFLQGKMVIFDSFA